MRYTIYAGNKPMVRVTGAHKALVWFKRISNMFTDVKMKVIK